MRLIDADALEPDADYDDGDYWAVSMAQIYNAPTIEPERKTGKWLMDGEKYGELMWRCSECRVSEVVPTATSFVSGIVYPQWKFCPNCGSRMDGGEQDG